MIFSFQKFRVSFINECNQGNFQNPFDSFSNSTRWWFYKTPSQDGFTGVFLIVGVFYYNVGLHINKRNEITKAEKKQIKPMSAQWVTQNS